MANPIETLIVGSASAVYDSPEFKTIIEDHLSWLLSLESTRPVSVTPHQIEVYDFDWIGLLQALRVPIDLHWIVIRMNGGMSLTDVPNDLRAVYVPEINVISNLMMLNNSGKGTA